MTAPVSNTTCCPGLHQNTRERLHELRENYSQEYPSCRGWFTCLAPLGYEGQAETWENERDSFKDDKYAKGVGFGLLSRVQRLGGVIVTTPISAATVGVGCVTSALAFTCGTLCLPISCCTDSPMELCSIGCRSLGTTALTLTTLVKGVLCLPCDVVAPEVGDMMGNQQLNLAIAEMQHSISYKKTENQNDGE